MAGSTISPPTIDEPVYKCAGVVVVRGFIAGARIDIFLTGHDPGSPPIRLGGGVSYSPIGQVFAVLDPTKVVDTAAIYAIQTFAGTPSASSSSVMVQPSPPSPVPPRLTAPLLECATCVRVDDAIPGATVEVLDGGRVIGIGQAGGGTVDVDLSPPLIASHSISARDVYCGQNWPPSPSIGGVTSTRGQRKDHTFLPIPRVEEPVFACQRYVAVSGCRPGCLVGLSVNRAVAKRSATGGTSIALVLDSELQEGDALTANETLCDNSIGGQLSDPPAIIKSATSIPRPMISSPLYAGDTKIGILASIIGETVKVSADGAQIGMATASGAGTMVLGVNPPLVAGERVIADVQLCDTHKSSIPMMVRNTPSVVPAPRLPEPLFECGSLVTVTRCLPNAEVRIFAATTQQGGHSLRLTIGVGRAGGGGEGFSSMTIGVTPALQTGWRITATQKVGNTTSSESPTVTVGPHPALDAPEIIPRVYACSTCVEVNGVVPGARVDVLQDDSWVGGAYAPTTTVVVDVAPPLRSGSTLTVMQTLCGEASSTGKITVSPAPTSLPVPRVNSAYVGSSAVVVGDLIRGALVEVEETSSFNTVIGHISASSAEQVVPLNISLFLGAQIRVRQSLCMNSEYSPIMSIGYPPEWPLGDGTYGAGFLEVDDIPISDMIHFTSVDDQGIVIKRPSKNKALIYYPSVPGQSEGMGAPVADGPFPLVIVGHAKRWPPPIAPTCTPDVPADISQDFTQLSGILSHLARWGFVSICPDISWLVSDSSHENRELAMDDAIEYMLSENARSGSTFFGKIVTNSLGALGHSSGGNATVYVGTSGDYPVTVMALLAPAVAAMGESSATDDISQLSAYSPNPVMIVFGTEDNGSFGADGAPPLYFSSAGPPKYMVTIDGADHFGFTDSLCLASPGDGVPTINQSQQQRIAKAYITALFARYLTGFTAMDAYLDNERSVEELEDFVITVQTQH
jgi:hypothetical protein